MEELFRLKIVSGRVFLPVRLTSRLAVEDGDELRVLIKDDDSVSLTTAKASDSACAPSADDLAELKKRKRSRVSRSRFEQFIREIVPKKARTTTTHG